LAAWDSDQWDEGENRRQGEENLKKDSAVFGWCNSFCLGADGFCPGCYLGQLFSGNPSNLD
jgi:hypothetical protein